MTTNHTKGWGDAEYLEVRERLAVEEYARQTAKERAGDCVDSQCHRYEQEVAWQLEIGKMDQERWFAYCREAKAKGWSDSLAIGYACDQVKEDEDE